jgi:hypothetical protein
MTQQWRDMGQSNVVSAAMRLLNHRRLRDHRSPLLPLCFPLALLFGRALARGDLVEGAPFRFHSQVGPSISFTSSDPSSCTGRLLDRPGKRLPDWL